MTDLVNRLRSAATMPFKEAYRTLFRQSADEIERLQKALAEIADPSLALLASTKADIARDALTFMEGVVPRNVKLTGGNPAPSASYSDQQVAR